MTSSSATESLGDFGGGQARFDGRVAVITGAGRGLGRAYALLLAAKGAKVVVNDPGVGPDGTNFDNGPADDVVREIQAAGGAAVACTESVATADGGRAIVDTAIEHFGRIDILVHNAGINRYGLLPDMTHEDFDAVLDVHLRGAFHVVRPAFPLMAAAGYGRIVLTSSILGFYGNHRVANYAASKGGIIGLAGVVAVEGADHGVKCNVIVPAALTRLAAALDTSAYPPMGPELAAPVVGWLAHESCSVNGETLISIAGRVAKAYVAETRGVYRPEWSIDSVGEQIDEICDTTDPWVLPSVSGYGEHLKRSFAIAREGSKHVSQSI
ncbi:SDR family NAD(P)-dependent oxidoreductase [Rhodococcus sp. P1Y]|uniref:SDR family NAD(P)-dependent oxidoreductase n=1 Tax=Rhodococcus sp. P1Y TaxID=1302308 RepID=UPI000EB3C98E|nr:SDR family NAD(P)-dependent oxidoreductase [Rhodococcus sp. P1Y]AYJ50353.1 SDR family NAD(P)-dependent oxidoreductase [Rhodococcus sp. P1Y]